jgi:hypothetical protein
MISLLLLWLVKRCRSAEKTISKSPARKMASLLLILLYFSGALPGQNRAAVYDVLHNGEVKGTLVLNREADSGRLHIKIVTQVSTRILFRIAVKSIEEAVFEKGNLIYSSLYREVNGEEKVNQQLQFSGGSYRLISKEAIADLPVFPIRFCVLLLYCQEPVNIRQVYSDNYHQYLEIKKAGRNKYQVIFPNGNSNYYCYENGICTRVEVDQFYHLEFRLQ